MDPNANIIVGTIIDEALGDEVRVTVIAAGFDESEDILLRESPSAARQAAERKPEPEPEPEPEPIREAPVATPSRPVAQAPQSRPVRQAPTVPPVVNEPPARRAPDLDIPAFLFEDN